MKKFCWIAIMLSILFLCSACVPVGLLRYTRRGEDTAQDMIRDDPAVQVEAPNAQVEEYRLFVEDVDFIRARQMHIEIYPTQEQARVEIDYSEDFPSSALGVSISGDRIRIQGERGMRAYYGEYVRITVYANCPEITISGGFSLQMDASGLKNVDMMINGAINGTVEQIESEKVNIVVNGAAKMNLLGETQSLVCTVNGAGDVDAQSLQAQKAEVQVHGAGNVDVYASDTLKASIAGVGRIRYYGDPSVYPSVWGVGTITRGD